MTQIRPLLVALAIGLPWHSALAQAPQEQKNDEPKGSFRAEWDLPAPGQDQPARDLFGDPLPDGAIARIGANRFRCSSRLTNSFFSPDGKWIAGGNFYGGPVCVWDASTGRRAARFFDKKGNETLVCLGFVGNTRLATRTSDRFQFWNMTREGEPVSEAAVDGAIGTPLRDSLFAILSTEGKIVVWDVQAKRIVRTFAEHCIGFKLSGDRTRIFIDHQRKKAPVKGEPATDEFVDWRSIWDVATGKQALNLLNFPVNNLVDARAELSHDGRTITFLDTQTDPANWEYRTFDIATSKETSRKPWAPDEDVFGKQLSPDGKTLARINGLLSVYDAKTNALRWQFLCGEEDQVRGWDFSPDSRYLVIPDHRRVRIFDTMTGQERLPIGDNRDRSFLKLSGDGRMLATWIDGPTDEYEERRKKSDKGISRVLDRQVQFCDAATGATLEGLLPESLRKSYPAWLSSDLKTGMFWAGSTLETWHLPSQKKLSEGQGGYQMARAFASPDGAYTWTNLHQLFPLGVEVRDSKTGRRLLIFPGAEVEKHPGWFFSPNSKSLGAILTGADDVVKIWDLPSGELRLIEPKSATICAAGLSPDGRILLMFTAKTRNDATDVQLLLWDFAENKPLPTPEISLPRFGFSYLFHPDNRRLLLYRPRPGELFVVDRTDGRVLASRKIEAFPQEFSDDGRILVTNGAELLVWDFEAMMKKRP